MSFTNKKITLVFTLGTGQFGETGQNQVTVTGLRVSAKIVKSGGASMCECQLRIFGLLPTIYNQLTSIYQVTQGVQRNTVEVRAGDDEGGVFQVFVGQILTAQIDLNSQPDSVMNIIAQTGYLQAVQPTAPVAYPVGCKVVDAMRALATVMRLNFEPNDVTAVLPKGYYHGTAWQQAQAIVEAAGIKWNCCDDGTLAIWTKNGGRIQQQIPEISYLTNLIGYPSYSNMGIGLKCLYNPNVIFGGFVQLVTDLKVTNLNGKWQIFSVVHTLESEMPGGQWMTELQGFSKEALAPPKTS